MYEVGFPGGFGFSIFGIMATIIPIIVVGGILFIIIRGLSTWMSNNASELRQDQVTVISKRIKVWGGSNNSSANTSYYITFELSSRERVEFAVNGTQYGTCREGETGLLAYQGSRFKGFQPQATATAVSPVEQGTPKQPMPQAQPKSRQEPFRPQKISYRSAEHYNWGASCDGWHLVKGSDLSVIHERMPGKTEEVRHYHARSRQFFFVLSGEASLEVDGARLVLREQEGAEVPPGIWHQIKNERYDDVEFLVISTPPTRGDRIETE